MGLADKLVVLEGRPLAQQQVHYAVHLLIGGLSFEVLKLLPDLQEVGLELVGIVLYSELHDLPKQVYHKSVH